MDKSPMPKKNKKVEEITKEDVIDAAKKIGTLGMATAVAMAINPNSAEGHGYGNHGGGYAGGSMGYAHTYQHPQHMPPPPSSYYHPNPNQMPPQGMNHPNPEQHHAEPSYEAARAIAERMMANPNAYGITPGHGKIIRFVSRNAGFNGQVLHEELIVHIVGGRCVMDTRKAV